jgi:hypothetical protein
MTPLGFPAGGFFCLLATTTHPNSLGQSEADQTNQKNQKDSAELNKLWSELEALKQQMAQLHARQLQCETTRERFAALEASLLGVLPAQIDIQS